METQSVHPFVLPLPKRGSVDTPFDEKATCTVLNEKDPATEFDLTIKLLHLDEELQG